MRKHLILIALLFSILTPIESSAIGVKYASEEVLSAFHCKQSYINGSSYKRAANLLLKIQKSKKKNFVLKYEKTKKNLKKMKGDLTVLYGKYFNFGMPSSAFENGIDNNKKYYYHKVNVKQFKKALIKSRRCEAKIKEVSQELGLSFVNPVGSVTSVNKWLCDNVNYNDDYTTVYDALFNYGAVCAGYAETFMAFMDYIGIPCQCVYSNKICHAFNKLIIMGIPRYVDVTWNDTAGVNSWLLLDESAILFDHYEARFPTKKTIILR